MSTTLAFIDESQGASFQSLTNTSFQVAVIDPNDSRLTPSQIAILQGSDKTLLAYLSVGEAENFRSYWQKSWSTRPSAWPRPAIPGSCSMSSPPISFPKWRQRMVG